MAWVDALILNNFVLTMQDSNSASFSIELRIFIPKILISEAVNKEKGIA
jgi:hypothetical protein